MKQLHILTNVTTYNNNEVLTTSYLENLQTDLSTDLLIKNQSELAINKFTNYTIITITISEVIIKNNLLVFNELEYIKLKSI